jgi:serine protease AprX
MPIVARRFSTLAAGLVILLAVTPASAQPLHKFDRVLQEVVQKRTSSEKRKVIVRARPGYREWLRQHFTARGVSIDADHPSIDGLTVALSADGIATFCAVAAVEGCAVDADVAATALAAAAATTPTSTMLGSLGLKAASTGGAGVTVALIDSGLHPSKAFQGRIKAFFDFTGGTIRQVKPFDDYGHGTHVAGLIGGAQASADLAYQGVAPGVQFVVLKVLGKTGAGKTSDVIRAIEFAVANSSDSTLSIDVINLSLGHPIYQRVRNGGNRSNA